MQPTFVKLRQIHFILSINRFLIGIALYQVALNILKALTATNWKESDETCTIQQQDQYQNTPTLFGYLFTTNTQTKQIAALRSIPDVN